MNNPGESGTTEGVMMAGFGGYKVMSVDYRMAPDHVSPAALDDVMTVWKAALKMSKRENMAVFGSSARGRHTQGVGEFLAAPVTARDVVAMVREMLA